ncbi:S1 RNA-binding domain-containing protein [Vagococcus coleopterorum]|uniref:S1 RNA-binding domain-containing protein n=1 Tax=Vagococcus coleopterorum TaxID=2714946 RepID=A0A6G8APT2_9ENTE|nr:CvfD/Ygs/GSP13 family RNA-binding post-transcriptional regulator [Vagococcus coleopterorum]QIL46997.1 S1 RNA-binding domain-containing protein [Vagococcus coleopterorum]
MEYRIGMEIDGVVTGVQPYGAFVSLEGEQQGLVHISEVKHGFIKNISDVLAVGDKVRVKVIDIDEYSKKISLSMRALETEGAGPAFKYKKYFTDRNKNIGFKSLADVLPEWIEENLEQLDQRGK